MTAVEWLIKEVRNSIKGMSIIVKEDIFKQAKEMEKQHIMEFVYSAVRKILDEDRQNPFNLEQYYNETYGSKGSDETKTDNI